MNADAEVDTVFTEVCEIFGALPPKEVRTIRRKKKKQAAVTEDEEEEEEEWEDFSGQRIIFVLGEDELGTYFRLQSADEMPFPMFLCICVAVCKYVCVLCITTHTQESSQATWP